MNTKLQKIDGQGAAQRDAWLRRLQLGLGIAGAVLIAVWLAAWSHGKLMSQRELDRFEEARRQMLEVSRLEAVPDQDLQHGVDVSLWAPGRIEAYQASLFEEFGAPMAVLRVPRLDIEVPVLGGTSDSALNRGAGWIEGTAAPGSGGNCGIAGHRDGFFRGLKDIELGDAIEVETLGGTLHYFVDDLTIVDPSDVSVLAAREAPTITLVTCYPFYFVGNAPQRFIVHATLRSAARPPAAAGEAAG